MKTLIVFPKAGDVEEHTAHIDTVPRQGDWLDLPDVSTQGHYPVERVIWRLSRGTPGQPTLEIATDGSPQVEIHLGPLQLAYTPS